MRDSSALAYRWIPFPGLFAVFSFFLISLFCDVSFFPIFLSSGERLRT